MALEMDSNSTGFFSRQDGAGWGDRSIQTHTAASTALKPYGCDILVPSSAMHFHVEQPTQVGIDKHIVVCSTETITIVLGPGAKGGVHLNTTNGPTVIKTVNMTTAAKGTSHYSRCLHLRAAASNVWALLTPLTTVEYLLSTAT